MNPLSDPQGLLFVVGATATLLGAAIGLTGNATDDEEEEVDSQGRAIHTCRLEVDGWEVEQ
jgi:hypothetical protein